jgi:F-type H+-transporting ATPase subunit c
MRIRKSLTFLFVLLTSMLTTGVAFASDAAAEGGDMSWVMGLSAALAIGIAASFGAIAQSKAASTALEGIARNPNASGKIFTPMILGLALIESLVIYALIIAFMLLAKV